MRKNIMDVNILIAEDHTLTATLLAGLLTAKNGYKVAGIATNGYSVLDYLSKKTIDLCLLDISMPYLDGLETLEKINKQFPNVKVLMVSGHTEDWIIEKCMKSGANGYLTKQSDTDEVIRAIEKITKGRNYLDKYSASVLTRLNRKQRKSQTVLEH